MTATNDIQKLLEEIKLSTAAPITVISQTEFAIPEEISLIQNQYDIIYNELKKMKADVNNRIAIVDKTEFIINVLNYKTYEIRYNFRNKLNELQEAKEALIGDTSERKLADSSIALKLCDIEKEISDSQNLYESQMQSIKEQILEAQKQYEDVANILDTCLENIRKYYNVLLLLIQAEKEQLSDLQTEIAEVKYSLILEGLQKEIDRFIELQTAGWTTKKPLEKMSVLLEERGVKLTKSGLLMTNSGHRITYEEARDQNLLDDMTFSMDFFTGKGNDAESIKSKQSKEGSKESEYSRMSSEDVQYLKENLGLPLTLALSEITAVQPKDPIHYLGHWLFKYRYNQEISDIQRIELEQISNEREKLAKERWHKFIEEEATTAVLECIIRAEEESARNELLRIKRELEAAEGEELDPYMGTRHQYDL